MTKHENRDQMLQRHEIVMRIMAVNSEQLRCDSERCGLEVELLKVCDGTENSSEVQALESRIAELEHSCQERLKNLEKLNDELAGFDDNNRSNSSRNVG